MTIRKILAGAAATGLAVAGLAAVAPVASAVNSTPVTENPSFNYQCLGIEYETLGGRTNNNGAPAHAIVNTSATTVTYPKEVSPGQAFSVTIQPGQWKTSGEEMGNAKYDIALPAGVTVTGVSNAGGNTGISQKNGSLKVERVGADGAPSATGEFARIWGQSTVNNGGTEKTNDPKNGIYSVQSGTFRFPKVKIDMVAPTTAGATVAVGLRGAGTTAERSGINNVLSFGLDKRDGVFGADNFNNDDYWCTSPASTAALTSTRVIGSTTAAFTTTNLGIESGTVDTLLEATVTSNAGSPKPVSEGEVEFFVDGTSIGRAPVSAGKAALSHTFPPLDDREPIAYEVTARYLGIPNKFEGSSDTRTTATVEPPAKTEVTSTASIAVAQGAPTGNAVPVSVTTTLDTSDGLDLPSGATVEILRDGAVIGTAPVSGLTATYVDTLDAGTSGPVTHTYTARLAELETYDTIYRASAESAPESVTIVPRFATHAVVHVDPASVLVGHAADLDADVTADGAPLPAGSEVVFRVDGRDVGTATTDAEGHATLPGHVFDTPGVKSVVAVYEGAETEAGRFLPTTSEGATLTVEALPTIGSHTVLSLKTSVTAGDEVTMKAVVTRADGTPLSAVEAQRLGSVWFYRDGEAIGSAPVTVDAETGESAAVYRYRFAERGEFRVTAEYSGVTAGDEVLAPSETEEATVVKVTPTEIVIDEPTPPAEGGGTGSLDSGSLAGLMGGSGPLASLSAISSGN